MDSIGFVLGSCAFFPYTTALESVVLNSGVIFHGRENGGHSEDIMTIPRKPYTVLV
jgi:hypothetical protein